jgi:pimeloyl-ACP methyl ester carboxylesterase
MNREPSARMIPLATGLRYHVLEWGADDPSLDHTVVLVHGLLDLAWGWAPTVQAGLAGLFHVVVPDLRGHGDSDRVGLGGYYHFFDHLADLHALLDVVGRERVSLVGHSMGGSVASYYAGAYPRRIHRLALLEGTGGPELGGDGPEDAARWLESWKQARERAGKSYASVQEAAARLREHDPLLTEELALELARRATVELDGRLRFKHDPLHLTFDPRPFRFDDARQFWRAITCPVLLVEAELSVFRLPPDEKARRHGCFPDRRCEVLPGAAHMMHRHQPAALARLLADFLKG